MGMRGAASNEMGAKVAEVAAWVAKLQKAQRAAESALGMLSQTFSSWPLVKVHSIWDTRPRTGTRPSVHRPSVHSNLAHEIRVMSGSPAALPRSEILLHLK